MFRLFMNITCKEKAESIRKENMIQLYNDEKKKREEKLKEQERLTLIREEENKKLFYDCIHLFNRNIAALTDINIKIECKPLTQEYNKKLADILKESGYYNVEVSYLYKHYNSATYGKLRRKITWVEASTQPIYSDHLTTGNIKWSIHPPF